MLLECDGTRIPLPSLQGIVVLNIPSFMGGTNFWGGNKEDDCFIAPSFDDRVLEVVAVFGSVQMAASRIINLQHHRIAQCHSVKITILGKYERVMSTLLSNVITLFCSQAMRAFLFKWTERRGSSHRVLSASFTRTACKCSAVTGFVYSK